jgi:TPR repeat protein
MRTLAAVVMLTVLAYAIPARADTIVDTLAAAKAADARQDFVTELMLLRPLAKQGNATAQTSLGLMYGNGRGVPKDDMEAVRWYRKAAEQGDAHA